MSLFESNIVILHMTLYLSRDQHLYNTGPLYLPEEKSFVTETQVIRETLWYDIYIYIEIFVNMS